MSAELPHHLQHIVEDICHAGCRRVNEMLVRLDQGEDIEQVKTLSPQERAQVIAELKHIMAVYDKCE